MRAGDGPSVALQELGRLVGREDWPAIWGSTGSTKGLRRLTPLSLSPRCRTRPAPCEMVISLSQFTERGLGAESALGEKVCIRSLAQRLAWARLYVRDLAQCSALARAHT